MPLETPTYVMDLVETNPPGTDAKSQGDNHIRNIKLALKNTFPTATRAFNLRRWAEKEAAFETQAADRNMVSTDDGKLEYFDCSGAARIYNLLAVASAPEGMIVFIDRDNSANSLTIDPAGVETINGAANFVFKGGDTGLIYRGATEWRALAVSRRPATQAEGNAGLDSIQPLTPAVDMAATNRSAGYIYKLTLSNDAGDLTNDIGITVGAARDDGDAFTMVLGSALIKQLDAAWAPGTNQGMRASGAAIADTTYHIFLIRRPDTGVVDIAADTSPTGANLAANTNAAYTQKRRIGSIIRAAGAIVAFRQVGNLFRRAAVTDRSSTSAAASALLTLSVPTGITVQPLLSLAIIGGASVTCSVSLGDAAAGAIEVGIMEVFTGAGDTNDEARQTVPPIFTTNTSAQLYFAQVNTAGTPTASKVTTLGWIDNRGQDGGL